MGIKVKKKVIPRNLYKHYKKPRISNNFYMFKLIKTRLDSKSVSYTIFYLFRILFIIKKVKIKQPYSVLNLVF